MKESTVTVFGGTGFLGRCVVRRLRERGFPSGSRRGIQIAAACRVSMAPQLESIQADIHDERSVADAVAGAYGLVNAVSLYAERG
ncbi:MAG: hypothetical protein WAL48_14295 [Xanthobacteraceae bacterium]|jgi:uncharacterized protein YbjT (DUF2867 family)